MHFVAMWVICITLFLQNSKVDKCLCTANQSGYSMSEATYIIMAKFLALQNIGWFLTASNRYKMQTHPFHYSIYPNMSKHLCAYFSVIIIISSSEILWYFMTVNKSIVVKIA